MISTQKVFFSVFLGGLLLSIYVLPSHAHDDHSHEQNDSITPSDLSVKPKTKNPKTMQNARWITPKDKSSEDNVKEIKAEATDISEDPVTEDQKLWKKYKDLAAGSKANKPQTNKAVDNTDSSASDTTHSEKANTGEENANSQTAEEDTEKDMPIGLKGILESYHNAQKNKGQMNSRSFGKID